MNSTWIKLAIAYTAGMITYAVYQNFEVREDLDKISLMMNDVPETDSISVTTSFACDDANRYNIDPRLSSENFPIDKVDVCKEMIAGSGPTAPENIKGAWFSKLTLDLMFCHAPDANGIFIYQGTMPGNKEEVVYIAEASRNSRVTTVDDGTSYIYYSRTLCPTICGSCGN